MNQLARVTGLTLVVALSGCATNLSGVGGTQRYACKAPVGALCTSVSGVYANALHGRSEVPRPPQTTPTPTVLSDKAESMKGAQPLAGTSPITSLGIAVAKPPLSESKSPPSLPSAPHSDGPSSAATALRSSPRVLRLWLAPWEDDDGDLHDASFVHVVVDNGRWLIERVRPIPHPRLDDVMPPRPLATPPQAPSDSIPPAMRSQVSDGDTMPGLDVQPAAR